MDPAYRFARLRRWLTAMLVVGGGFALTGCQTARYYTQALMGECQILAREQSCAKLIADPHTPLDLKAKLDLTREICAFAERELKLKADGHYRRYADLARPFVVWNIYAAPQFSLEAKTWWYPWVGRLDYRGFFAEPDARQNAARLSGQGWDVYVEGVEAYSTLGWFKDPLLNTFIHHDEAVLAEILFHELAHQRVFAAGDTDFNEAFATTVGEEGARRWLRAKGDATALERYLTARRQNRRFVQLVQNARHQLEVLYGDERTPDGRIDAAKRGGEVASLALASEKQRILEDLRGDYQKLKAEWGGESSYDDWFARGVNNAQLNSVATYYDLVPAFERLLATSGGDLDRFYAAAKQLARLPRAERHQRLQDH
jgi:predicted aminopeptidase